MCQVTRRNSVTCACSRLATFVLSGNLTEPHLRIATTPAPTPEPSSKPIADPTRLPTPLPSSRLISEPSAVPSPRPTSPRHSSLPTPRPSSARTQMLTALPTLEPTTITTATVSVSFAISATAAPSDADLSALKTTIAAQLGVGISQIKKFAVTHTENQQRRLQKASPTDARMRRLGYSWLVSFDLQEDLAATPRADSASWESSVYALLSSDSFSSAVVSAVPSALSVSDVSTVDNSRSSPATAPADNAAAAGTSSGDPEGASTMMVLVAAIVGTVLVLAGGRLAYKRFSQRAGPSPRPEPGPVDLFMSTAAGHSEDPEAANLENVVKFRHIGSALTTSEGLWASPVPSSDLEKMLAPYRGNSEQQKRRRPDRQDSLDRPDFLSHDLTSHLAFPGDGPLTVAPSTASYQEQNEPVEPRGVAKPPQPALPPPPPPSRFGRALSSPSLVEGLALNGVSGAGPASGGLAERKQETRRPSEEADLLAANPLHGESEERGGEGPGESATADTTTTCGNMHVS